VSEATSLANGAAKVRKAAKPSEREAGPAARQSSRRSSLEMVRWTISFAGAKRSSP
jgi:hypothetical protein